MECSYNMLSLIIDALSPRRSSEYSTWYIIVQSINNACPDRAESYELIHRFSAKSGKYDPGRVDLYMRTLHHNPNGCGIPTLMWFLKDDNADVFRVLHKRYIYPLVEKCMSVTNYDVAVLVHAVLRYTFALVKNQWYYRRDDGTWSKVNARIHLSGKMSTEVVALLEDSYFSQFDVTNLTYKLRMTMFKDNIIRECRYLFETDELTHHLPCDL